MHQVLNFIVLTITTAKSPNDADIKGTKLHVSLLKEICCQFMVGRYTISAQCTLFTQVVYIPNTFKVLQGNLSCQERSNSIYILQDEVHSLLPSFQQ